MDKKEFSIQLGKKVKRLRQERGWSQEQLAQKLNIHQKQISKYERGIHIPSVEVLVHIASIFNVSLDYMTFGDSENTTHLHIADRELIRRLHEINHFSEQDKTTLKAVLDVFITKSRFQRLAAEGESVVSPPTSH